MADPSFRDKIQAYVDENWMVPCRDGLVWVYYAAIDTKAQVAKQKTATKADWAAAFLQYPDPTYGSLEGLYLIPAGDMGKVRGGQFDANQYKVRKMISSWYDKADKNNFNPEVVAQKPEYNGLNDCAHYVTQSLAAGGVHFGRDDTVINAGSGLLGWWQVRWRGVPFYYYFDKTGRVGWVKNPPAKLTQPLHAPEGRGYWFPEVNKVTICWSNTGSLEVLAVRPPQPDTHMEGTWNGSEPLIADKM